MKKMSKSIFVLALCILAWQGVNMAGNGGNEKKVIYKGLSKAEIFVYDYIDHGETNNICYISYHTEVRRDDRGSRKVTVVHIVER